MAWRTATGAHASAYTDQWTEHGRAGFHFKGPYIVYQTEAIMKHNSITPHAFMTAAFLTDYTITLTTT